MHVGDDDELVLDTREVVGLVEVRGRRKGCPTVNQCWIVDHGRHALYVVGESMFVRGLCDFFQAAEGEFDAQYLDGVMLYELKKDHLKKDFSIRIFRTHVGVYGAKGEHLFDRNCRLEIEQPSAADAARSLELQMPALPAPESEVEISSVPRFELSPAILPIVGKVAKGTGAKSLHVTPPAVHSPEDLVRVDFATAGDDRWSAALMPSR